MVAQRFTSPAPTPVIAHYSTVFDGRTPVLCGWNEIPKPAVSEWRYVSCLACLEIGARSNAKARATLEQRLREAAALKAANDVKPDLTFDIRKAAGDDNQVLQAHLEALDREHEREAIEIDKLLASMRGRRRRR